VAKKKRAEQAMEQIKEDARFLQPLLGVLALIFESEDDIEKLQTVVERSLDLSKAMLQSRHQLAFRKGSQLSIKRQEISRRPLSTRNLLFKGFLRQFSATKSMKSS